MPEAKEQALSGNKDKDVVMVYEVAEDIMPESVLQRLSKASDEIALELAAAGVKEPVVTIREGRIELRFKSKGGGGLGEIEKRLESCFDLYFADVDVGATTEIAHGLRDKVEAMEGLFVSEEKISSSEGGSVELSYLEALGVGGRRVLFDIISERFRSYVDEVVYEERYVEEGVRWRAIVAEDRLGFEGKISAVNELRDEVGRPKLEIELTPEGQADLKEYVGNDEDGYLLLLVGRRVLISSVVDEGDIGETFDVTFSPYEYYSRVVSQAESISFFLGLSGSEFKLVGEENGTVK